MTIIIKDQDPGRSVFSLIDGDLKTLPHDRGLLANLVRRLKKFTIFHRDEKQKVHVEHGD